MYQGGGRRQGWGFIFETWAVEGFGQCNYVHAVAVRTGCFLFGTIVIKRIIYCMIGKGLWQKIKKKLVTLNYTLKWSCLLLLCINAPRRCKWNSKQCNPDMLKY